MVLSQTKQCLFSGRGGVLLVRIKGLRGQIRQEKTNERTHPQSDPLATNSWSGPKKVTPLTVWQLICPA